MIEWSTCRHCKKAIRLLPGVLIDGGEFEPWTSGAIGTPVTFYCDSLQLTRHEPYVPSTDEMLAELKAIEVDLR